MYNIPLSVIGILACVPVILAIKLAPCQDVGPPLVCKRKFRQTREMFREQCVNNWPFARFQCCASCAVALEVGIKIANNSVIFIDQEGAKRLLLPKRPCVDESMPGGTSFTEWCQNMIHRANKNPEIACSADRSMQQHCLKTCNFEECQMQKTNDSTEIFSKISTWPPITTLGRNLTPKEKIPEIPLEIIDTISKK